jgi:hypothetical protein
VAIRRARLDSGLSGWIRSVYFIFFEKKSDQVELRLSRVESKVGSDRINLYVDFFHILDLFRLDYRLFDFKSDRVGSDHINLTLKNLNYIKFRF